MKPTVIFRADGNSSIGLGHVLRLLSLAEMLKDQFQLIFYIQQPTPYVVELISPFCNTIVALPLQSDYLEEAKQLSTQYLNGNEIVVLDGYYFESEYQLILKDKCGKLVCIDDLHSWYCHADALINHAEGVSKADYKAAPETKFYLGLKYALLRTAFFEQPLTRRSIPAVTKVFVSMGGADVYNVTLKITEALASAAGISEITLLIGKVNPHYESVANYIRENKLSHFHIKSNLSASEVAAELRSAQLAICPASTTAIEACAVGIGIISGTTASNQQDILKGLTAHNCLLNLGDLTLVSPEQIRAAVIDLSENTDAIVKMMLAQRELIDGKSPERIFQLFTNLTNA
jgi:UDP-2,4-diacetamido-2,4,6-trideoxy-beta-L-altropyranose hydrolase